MKWLIPLGRREIIFEKMSEGPIFPVARCRNPGIEFLSRFKEIRFNRRMIGFNSAVMAGPEPGPNGIALGK
jgi:hypothetical protein